MIHPRTLKSLEFDQIIARLVSHCSSEAGSELAAAKKPYKTRAEAEACSALFTDFQVWSGQQGQYASLAFPDTRGLAELIRAKTGPQGLAPNYSLDLDSFWGLREMLRLAQTAFSAIHEARGQESWPALFARVSAWEMPVQLLAALNRCISDDGLLKDESSPGLFQVRSELRGLHQSCIRKVRDFAQQYNMLPYLQDEFMTLSSDRYVLPLKANFKGRMQGIIHDWSQTGETCYFEPYFLVSINNRLQELKREEREEERKVLVYLTGLMAAELAGVESAQGLLAELDLLSATAKLAEELEAACVAFTDADSGIELLEARHPLLTLSRLAKKDAPPVRPLDIVLRPGERALIVTGGNAGGKTVCLKTLGLLAAMAMAGLPVPAGRGSHLPWFERIDAFIGDEQSLSDDVSTFSAQIDHLARSFRHLNSSGLALLDEFGAGTDPAEGAALAQAVHDELLDKGCFVLSATHFPALKSYALTRQGARAASMLFDPQTSRPLF
ncbi:MAG: endonuclease MutS2, partial [Desulfovibrio sp.]|nr:endonuclease MutS2 [Desulfovibrio sp.]